MHCTGGCQNLLINFYIMISTGQTKPKVGLYEVSRDDIMRVAPKYFPCGVFPPLLPFYLFLLEDQLS